MKVQELGPDDVLARIVRLERTLRRWRIVMVAVISGVGVLLLGAQSFPSSGPSSGAAKPPPSPSWHDPAFAARDDRIIEAEKFVLKDGKGRQRAVLGITQDDGVGLWLFDAQKRVRAKLVHDYDGAELLLVENEGPAPRRAANQSSPSREIHASLKAHRTEAALRFKHLDTREDAAGIPYVDLRMAPEIRKVMQGPPYQMYGSLLFGEPGGLSLNAIKRCQFGTSSDGISLELLDRMGNPRAVIGNMSIRSPKDGSTMLRPESSIVLINSENKVWATP